METKSLPSTETYIQDLENILHRKNCREELLVILHQFILDQIRGGQTHLGAGALAELGKTGGKDFKSIIEKIKKDTKSTWAQVLDAVYGEAKAAGGTAPAAQSQQQASVQQAPQAGPGQQALMDILGKINQRLGK